MSRAFLIAAVALTLGACTQGRVERAKPLPDQADACGAAKLANLLNTLPTSDVMAQIERTVGQRRIRTIAPGDVVTMDYSAERLNVETGEDGRIKRFRCG